MTRPACASALCFALALVACGGQDSSDPSGTGGSAGASGGAAGSGGTSAGGGGTSAGGGGTSAGGGGTSAGGGGTSAGGGGAGGGGAITCGTALTCTGGDVCVEETFEPTNCAPPSDPSGPCPAGKIQTFCGGAGGICCCDAAAPSTFKCDPGAGCAGAVDCTCLTCPSGKMCMSVGSQTSGVFRCEEPPKP